MADPHSINPTQEGVSPSGELSFSLPYSEPSSLLATPDASAADGDTDRDAASTKPSSVSVQSNTSAEDEETDGDDTTDGDASSENDPSPEDNPLDEIITAGRAIVKLRGIRPPSPYGDGFDMEIWCLRNSRNDYLRWFFNQWKHVNEHLVQSQPDNMQCCFTMAELGRIEQMFRLLDKLDRGNTSLTFDIMRQLSETYDHFFERLPINHIHQKHIRKTHKRMGGDPFFDVDFYGDYEISDDETQKGGNQRGSEDENEDESEDGSKNDDEHGEDLNKGYRICDQGIDD